MASWFHWFILKALLQSEITQNGWREVRSLYCTQINNTCLGFICTLRADSKIPWILSCLGSVPTTLNSLCKKPSGLLNPFHLLPLWHLFHWPATHKMRVIFVHSICAMTSNRAWKFFHKTWVCWDGQVVSVQDSCKCCTPLWIQKGLVFFLRISKTSPLLKQLGESKI